MFTLFSSVSTMLQSLSYGSTPLTPSAVSQTLYTDTFSALHELLHNVLARDLSPDGLQAVFKVSFLSYP